MQVYLKRYFWVINVIAVVVCAVFAASALNHYVEGKYLGGVQMPEAEAAPPEPKKPRRVLSKRGKPLADRHMFCHECSPPEPVTETPEGPIEDSDRPPGTSLPLKLIATHVSEDATASFATVFNTSSSVIGAYRVEGKIPEAGKVVRITGKYVDFQNESSRRVERLSLLAEAPRSSSPPPAAKPKRTRKPRGERAKLAAEFDEGINKIDDTNFEIERDLVNKVIANPTAMRGARIVPSIKNGKPNGFKLYAIRPSSAFAKIGLQNGDTVHNINGFDLSTPDKALEVYTKVREASSISVSVTRRGKPVTLNYSIK